MEKAHVLKVNLVQMFQGNQAVLPSGGTSKGPSGSISRHCEIVRGAAAAPQMLYEAPCLLRAWSGTASCLSPPDVPASDPPMSPVPSLNNPITPVDAAPGFRLYSDSGQASLTRRCCILSAPDLLDLDEGGAFPVTEATMDLRGEHTDHHSVYGR